MLLIHYNIMPNVPKGKKMLLVYIDEELYKNLIEHIKSFYPGKSTYGLISIEVQQAIANWLNEKQASTHTHKQINPGIPKAQRNLDLIFQWLRSKGYINQFSLSDWNLACANTIGSDPRTVNKYLNLALKIGRAKYIVGRVYEIV